jgi:hypothetical protein
LTTPRPGGLNGLNALDPSGNPIAPPQGATTSTPTGGGVAPTQATAQTIGGGIAGVASKYEQDGIKVYNDQKSYNKWEFVYDITKDPARTGGTVPQPAAPQQSTTAGAFGNPMPNTPVNPTNPAPAGNIAPPTGFGAPTPTPPVTTQ